MTRLESALKFGRFGRRDDAPIHVLVDVKFPKDWMTPPTDKDHRKFVDHGKSLCNLTNSASDVEIVNGPSSCRDCLSRLDFHLADGYVVPLGVIQFYRSDKPWGFMSNLYPCVVVFEAQAFRSAEHAYQYGKSTDQVIKDYIQAAPFPRLASVVGHGLFIYDVVADWNKIKIDRMRAVVKAKFTQNQDLGVRLLATKSAQLVESSKTDGFWGLGKNGKGKNMLGTILMEIRDDLRKEEHR